MTALPRSFYARDALVVARDLLGKHLVQGSVVLRITEVEAYRWPNDSASHCRMGRTARNAPMWGPAGNAYVYLCYGIHRMLNVVTNAEGEGAAVLVRGCETVAGHDTVAERRGGMSGPASLAGPGKVASALALEMAHSGSSLLGDGPITIHDAPAVERYLVGPRIGIDYATPRDRRAPYRLAVAGAQGVSHSHALRRPR